MWIMNLILRMISPAIAFGISPMAGIPYGIGMLLIRDPSPFIIMRRRLRVPNWRRWRRVWRKCGAVALEFFGV